MSARRRSLNNVDPAWRTNFVSPCLCALNKIVVKGTREPINESGVRLMNGNHSRQRVALKYFPSERAILDEAGIQRKYLFEHSAI